MDEWIVASKVEPYQSGLAIPSHCAVTLASPRVGVTTPKTPGGCDPASRFTLHCPSGSPPSVSPKIGFSTSSC
eukprot:123834-Pyramimonas_sp.AAC.1